MVLSHQVGAEALTRPLEEQPVLFTAEPSLQPVLLSNGGQTPCLRETVVLSARECSDGEKATQG